MLVMIDLDNTLADRAAAVQAWIGEFCARFGLPAEAGPWILELDNDGYSARTKVLSAINRQFDLGADPDELLADYRRRVIELTVPVVGARDCLVALRAAGWTLAIVTNGSSVQQHAKIDALAFRDLVDAIVVSGDLGIKKPAAEIFEIAADRVGLSLDGGWMVGDSATHDIVGAHTLGLRTAWMSRGREWPVDLVPPTRVLSSLHGLPALIGAPGQA